MASKRVKPVRKKAAVKAKRKPVAARTKAGPPLRKRKSPRIRSAYESAQNTYEHDDHWPLADALNANAANSPDVRKTLRERSRSERDNNGDCGGLVERLGNDLIGTCPRLQLVIPGIKREVARRIEKAFAKWARQIGLGRKLRLMDNAAVVDGESFALLITNPRLDPAGVQLDLRLYETDQVETPWLAWGDKLSFYGGKLDELGNVVEWHFLKVHPGSDVWLGGLYDYDAIDSRRVLHWFKPRRAGQLRGVPEILSSLSLYAYLRRYTLATVNSAEFAASHAGVLESDATAMNETSAPTIETMDEVETPRGKLLTLPGGWKVSQLKAEQPVNTYKEFKGEILTGAGASLNAPRNISTNSSAEYNYSSGRLDHGIYQSGVKVRRQDLSDTVLDQIAYAWLDEAALIPGLIPDGLPLRSEWTLLWRFDGFVSIDPQKDATSNDLRLKNGSATLAKVVGEDGDDWEEHLEQLAAEEKRRLELGLPSMFVLTSPSPVGDIDPDAPEADMDAEQLRSDVEAYGIAVRAGAITPQTVDETAFRARMGLPPMSGEVGQAWQKDQGTRRPITLAPAGGSPATDTPMKQGDTADAEDREAVAV